MTSTHDDDLERLARKRAAMRLGWWTHATVFILVNMFLVGLSLMSGRTWAIYPFLGWGLGLAIHGAVVLLALPGGSSVMERLVQQERRRLALQRDPW